MFHTQSGGMVPDIFRAIIALRNASERSAVMIVPWITSNKLLAKPASVVIWSVRRYNMYGRPWSLAAYAGAVLRCRSACSFNNKQGWLPVYSKLLQRN